jgi:integrase/recombinase XerC
MTPDSQSDPLPALDLVPLPPDRVLTQSVAAAQPPAIQATDLYSALLADARCARTAEARAADIRDFTRFLGAPSYCAACAGFVAGGRGLGNALATAYVRSMVDRKLASATINRRLSTLHRLLVLAARFDLPSFALGVESLPDAPYRDTAGPGQAGWVRVLATASGLARRIGSGKRNVAILRLLHDHGLRREEVAALEYSDYDADGGRLWIQGKGQRSKVEIRLNKPTLLALSFYLDVRGTEPGPLFVRLDRARDKTKLQRLDADGIHKAVATLGTRAGLSRRLWPHALRHAGVTRILELTDGNIDKAQKFARHRDPRTTQRYDDRRKDVAGEMARLLGNDA